MAVNLHKQMSFENREDEKTEKKKSVGLYQRLWNP